MHTAFGKAGSIRQAPDALFAVLTNGVETDNTLGPQSHGVGPCSEGWLTSEKLALREYAIDSNVSRLTWMPRLPKRKQRELAQLLDETDLLALSARLRSLPIG